MAFPFRMPRLKCYNEIKCWTKLIRKETVEVMIALNVFYMEKSNKRKYWKMAWDAEVLGQTKKMTLDQNVNSSAKIDLTFVLTSSLFQIYLLILFPFLLLFCFFFASSGYSFMQSMVSNGLVNKFHVYFGYQFCALHSVRTHISNEWNRF